MFHSRYWRWLQPRFILRELVSLDDSAHAIALGSALGMWVGMTPTVGVQMPILLAIWFLIRRWLYFNVTASMLVVLVSNPLTTPPIYWFNYELGSWILGNGIELSFKEILTFDSFATWWDAVCALVVQAGWPLLVGSIVVATALAIPTYFAILAILLRFRDPIPVPGRQVLLGRKKEPVAPRESDEGDASCGEAASASGDEARHDSTDQGGPNRTRAQSSQRTTFSEAV